MTDVELDALVERLRAFLPKAPMQDVDALAAAITDLRRENVALRAALEELGFTGSLPEGERDRLVRERDEARAAGSERRRCGGRPLARADTGGREVTPW